MTKRLLQVAAVIMALFCILPAKAQEETPIITIHTDAYRIVGPSNAFRILLGAVDTEYYDVDFGWGMNEYEIGPFSMDGETGDLTGTWIPATVSEQGIIRIYGNAENINLIDIEGAHITEIEMDACKNLQILKLEHNDLEKLDLTPFTKLYGIYLSDNPFTEATPLVIGVPKPDLTILEIDIIDHFDQNFSFSDYPQLKAIDAYHNRDLRKADVTGCPGLLTLSLEMTDVAELDLSNNPELFHLNISDSRISEIDLSHLPKLQRLLAENVSGWINTDVKISSIDLSHNPELNYLRLAGNKLTSLDISHNPLLTNIGLNGNFLTGLDVSANRDIYSLWVMNNCMDFATLPEPEPTWGEYFYSQRPMTIAKSIKEGEPIDFSARVLRPGTQTSAVAMRMRYDGEPEPLDPALYSYADGKITFPQAIPDSVYVVFSNSMFTEYALTTTPFRVKTEAEFGQPSKIVTWTVKPGHPGSVAFKVGMMGATPETPKTFYVDLGNGELTPFTSTGALFMDEPNVTAEISKGSKKMALYIPEDEVLTYLSLDDTQLTAIDVTAATELIRLSLNNCNISSINLAYNRCLQTLDVSNNRLSTLDLEGIYGDYEKYVLKVIKAANNAITDFNLKAATTQVEFLDLSNNKLDFFTDFNFNSLYYLNVANNRIEGTLRVSYPTELIELDVSGNSISELLLYQLYELETLNIANNCLNMATLPTDYIGLGEGYIYAPQKPLQIISGGPGIDISDQYVDIDGNFTEFVWKRANGTPLVEGSEVTGENGLFKFPDPSVGSVYCEISNPGLPAFTGSKVLKTSNFTVKAAPTNLVASFTTAEDSENGEVIFAANNMDELYIDWRGDGVEYLPYPVTDTYTDYPEQKTVAGANVKVYTYDNPEDVLVFSLYNMKLSDCDLSRLTGATCLAAGDAGMNDGDLLLPENSSNLKELTIGGNNFTVLPDASRFPNLRMLSANNVQIPVLDLTPYKSLEVFAGSYGVIKEVHFDNPLLWFVDLSNNQLESIDLSGLPSLAQIGLMFNKLSTINLEPVESTLRSLSLVGNAFTFATLPVPSDYPSLGVYLYSLQAPIEVTPEDGVVDLSSQASVNGTPSEFYWFYGEIVESDGQIGGELLVEDEEYTIEDGVTTFLESFLGQNDKVMAIIYNTEFPNTYMKTELFNVAAVSVKDIEAAADATVNVFNLQGACIRKNVRAMDALKGLEPGIYIVNGRKYAIMK